MTNPISFAHLTDIHLALNGDSWGTLGTLAERLLAETIARLNAQPDLDFVVITGDVVDEATPGEIERFNALIAGLEKPWHFVPGNHDGFRAPNHPDTLGPEEVIPRIDPRLADPPPYPQRVAWSRAVAEGVRLIGLDSRLPGTWNGRIDPEQVAWLRGELDAHRDALVILAVHHPLHNLIARNREPYWSNFICDNGAEVDSLLDAYPNVRMVLSGHHHANQIRRRGNRLHVNTAALTGYPCSYRLIWLAPGENSPAGGRWHVQIETRSPADEGTRKLAYDLMLSSEVAYRYNSDDPSAWAEVVAGREEDQAFDGWLG